MVNNVHQHGATPANTPLERLLFVILLGIKGFFFRQSNRHQS